MLELAANFYMTRAHWTDNLEGLPGGGRRGTALCTYAANPAVVYDQQALDDSKFRAKRKLITALPVCGKCVTQKAKREAAAAKARLPLTDRQRWGAKRLAGKTLEEKVRLNVRFEGSCWRWMGARNKQGYGQLTSRGRRVSAHRLAYQFAVGPIPDGCEIDHTCRVRDCVNPAHLEAVTHAENVRRAAQARTHCPHGHEFTEANTRWVQKNGRRTRACRACINERRRHARVAKRKEAA